MEKIKLITPNVFKHNCKIYDLSVSSGSSNTNKSLYHICDLEGKYTLIQRDKQNNFVNISHKRISKGSLNSIDCFSEDSKTI